MLTIQHGGQSHRGLGKALWLIRISTAPDPSLPPRLRRTLVGVHGGYQGEVGGEGGGAPVPADAHNGDALLPDLSSDPRPWCWGTFLGWQGTVDWRQFLLSELEIVQGCNVVLDLPHPADANEDGCHGLVPPCPGYGCRRPECDSILLF